MKRILSLVLILILSIGMLCACQIGGDNTTTVPSTTEPTPTEPTHVCKYDVNKAKNYLNSLYIDWLDNNATSVDYTVATLVPVGSDRYTVEWTVDNDAITITPDDSGIEATVSVPSMGAEDVTYTLTGVVSAPDGCTAEISFELKVPALDLNTHEEYMAAEEDDVLQISGIVVAINAKSLGNKYNHVFLADASGKGGYYCYSVTADPAEMGVKVGMTVMVTGPMTPYSGMQEIKGGEVIILDETIKEVAPLDITELFAAGADLGAYVGMPVVVKGVEIGSQDMSKDTSQYLYFSIGEKQGYLRTYVTDFAVGNTADEMASIKATIDADHLAHFGYKADVTGILVLYSGAPYLIPMSAAPFTNYVEVEKTPAEKVAAEIDAISIPSKVTTETTLTLPSVGQYYDDVAITWTLDGNAVTESTTLVPTETPVDVSLVATIVCGDVTETKTYTITLSMAPISIPEVLASEDGTSVIVEGIVTEINTAWSEQYGNISVTIRDGEGNTLYIFRLKTNVEVGDAVKITGTVGSYNGAKQIAAGATAEITGHYTEVTIPEATAAEDGTLVVVKGTVKSIDTAWSEQYGNISVTIEDTDGNTLYIFRLATNVNVGDVLTITGTVGSYKGSKQIAAGAKAMIEETEDGEDDETTSNGPLTSLKTGDKVYIVAPAYNMALSADKVSADSYYNKGVDVSAGFDGLTDAEVWEVTINEDGTYTFTSLTGSVLALADSYSSLNDTGANKYWSLEEKSTGIYYVKNTGRGNYLEWYDSKGNWSSYATSSLSDLFEISFYLAQ